VTYAQSLDGSLTVEPGQPLALSGPEASRMTHELRATHAAILVGIGTVLADNPRLTVRLVEGPHPQPIVVDSQLRTPLDAHLLSHPTHALWIATTLSAPAERQAALEQAGARLLRLPADEAGRVSLIALLDHLDALGLRTLMVEGGAQIITAFLEYRLADRVVITIAPRLVGGLRVLTAPLNVPLKNIHYRILGEDMVVEGELAR
jgi:3,4-dihydroxy 2-butanone 4-phosphate synthase/GTP cyclohydrolase II